MAPSLSDLYQIFKLPRISNIPITNRCVVAQNNESFNSSTSTTINSYASKSKTSLDFLHLAISSSSISSYVLTPSPRLVWSYSLSPSIIVNALTVFEEQTGGSTYFAASVYNYSNKKHFLKLIVNASLTKGGSNAASLTSYSAKSNNEKEDSESSDSFSPELQILDVEFPHEIKNIKFSKNGKFVYLLLSNGDVQSYKFSIKAEDYENPISKISQDTTSATQVTRKRNLRANTSISATEDSAGSQLVKFSKYISVTDNASSSLSSSQNAGLLVNNNDGFLLVVKNNDSTTAKKQKTNAKSILQMILLNNGEVHEMSLVPVPQTVTAAAHSEEDNDELIFSYNSGTLYELNLKSQILSLYSLPDAHLTKQTPLSSLFSIVVDANATATSQSKGDVRLLSPAADRVILNIGSKVFLINSKFGAILADYNLPTTDSFSSNGTNSQQQQQQQPDCLLLDVGEVKGTSTHNSITSLNLLMLSNADNNYSLNNMAVNVGNNSLVESLGKGIELYCNKRQKAAPLSVTASPSKKSKNKRKLNIGASTDDSRATSIDEGKLVSEYLITTGSCAAAFTPENETEKNGMVSNKSRTKFSSSITDASFIASQVGIVHDAEVAKVKSFLVDLAKISTSSPEEFDSAFISFVKRREVSLEKVTEAAYTKNIKANSDALDEQVSKVQKILFKDPRKDFELSSEALEYVLSLVFAKLQPSTTKTIKKQHQQHQQKEPETKTTDNDVYRLNFVPKLTLIYFAQHNLFPLKYTLHHFLQHFKQDWLVLRYVIANRDLQLSAEDILLLLSELTQDFETDDISATLKKAAGLASNDNGNGRANDADGDVEMNNDENDGYSANNNADNLKDELIKSLISLLLATKSDLEIIKTVKNLLNSSSSSSSSADDDQENQQPSESISAGSSVSFNDNVDNLIFKIIALNHGIKLLNLIIDGIGILNFKFTNNEHKMAQLIKFCEVKAQEILRFEPVGLLIDEIVEDCEESLQKQQQQPQQQKQQQAMALVKTVAHGNEPKIVSVKNHKIDEKLSSIIGTGEAAAASASKEYFEEKVPVYSVERLINLN